MEVRDETLIRVSGEQIILRSAIKWLLAREAKRSGDIDLALREASEAIGRTVASLPTDESIKGTLQEGIDQLIAQTRFEANR